MMLVILLALLLEDLNKLETPYYQAEIYAIYILDAYQRKGIGKQLIKPIAKLLLSKKLSKYHYLGIGGKFKSIYFINHWVVK